MAAMNPLCARANGLLKCKPGYITQAKPDATQSEPLLNEARFIYGSLDTLFTVTEGGLVMKRAVALIEPSYTDRYNLNMRENPTPPVELDDLLAAEYNYIAETATQANEDRARVSSFYLIAVGSLLAALFSTQLFEPERFTQSVKLLFSLLFALLTMLGASTVLQLARLRGSWYESMLAMNHMKDFAMAERPELAGAFRWKTTTLPQKYKTNSVSYYQAVEVALIGGLMFGAATFFVQQAFFSITKVHWVLSILMGVAAILIQLRVYKTTLESYAPHL